MMAGFTGSSGWLDFGEWFSTERAVHHRHGVLLLSAAIFMVGGVRLFFELQVGAFVLYMLGAFLLPVLVGIFQSRNRLHLELQRLHRQPRHRQRGRALQSSAQRSRLRAHRLRHRGDAQIGLASSGSSSASSTRATTSPARSGCSKRTHMLSIPGAVAVAAWIALLMLAPLSARHRLHDQRGARLRRTRRLRVRPAARPIRR